MFGFCLLRPNRTVVQKRTLIVKKNTKKNQKTKITAPMYRAKQNPIKMVTRKPLLERLSPKTKRLFAF